MLISLLPSAVSIATKFQEDKKNENFLDVVKGIEVRLDKMLSEFIEKFNVILFWIRILLILQFINFILLILILILRGK
ncbi:MAG: hypothetical protein RQ990_04720 [Candidatus Hydrothermia bacterium]|nr:hypothetical protein [Candidatus Hydrothermia bacterium]